MSRESDLEAEMAVLRERVASLEERLESAFGGERESDHNSVLRKEVDSLRGKVVQLWGPVVDQAKEIHALKASLGGMTQGGQN